MRGVQLPGGKSSQGNAKAESVHRQKQWCMARINLITYMLVSSLIRVAITARLTANTYGVSSQCIRSDCRCPAVVTAGQQFSGPVGCWAIVIHFWHPELLSIFSCLAQCCTTENNAWGCCLCWSRLCMQAMDHVKAVQVDLDSKLATVEIQSESLIDAMNMLPDLVTTVKVRAHLQQATSHGLACRLRCVPTAHPEPALASFHLGLCIPGKVPNAESCTAYMSKWLPCCCSHAGTGF